MIQCFRQENRLLYLCWVCSWLLCSCWVAWRWCCSVLQAPGPSACTPPCCSECSPYSPTPFYEPYLLRALHKSDLYIHKDAWNTPSDITKLWKCSILTLWSYQRTAWRIIWRLPLQSGLCLIHSHFVQVSRWKSLIGDHLHYNIVWRRTQVWRDHPHLNNTHIVTSSGHHSVKVVLQSKEQEGWY